MSELDTAPAAETDIAESSSISDILAARHKPQAAHEPHREVGDETPAAEAPAADPAAPAPAPVAASAAVPAPKPETPAPAAPAAPTEEELAAKHPAWMRKELKAQRERANALERQLAQQARQIQPAREAPSEDDPNRPVTRAEIAAYHERERLISKLELSETSFVDKHGDDTFEEVREWLISKQIGPGNNPMEGWAMAQRSPWAAAYQQYQREKMAEEIGSDPVAYRAKLEEQIRSEYEAKQNTPQVERSAAAPTMQRAAPPAPASTARSAAPRDPAGRFTGPAPLNAVFRNKF